MKIAMTVLIVISVALATLLFMEVQTLHQQAAEIEHLKAMASDSSAQKLMDLQERCADQASKTFSALGYSLNSSNPMVQLQSHYNAAMKTCFLLIESTAPTAANVTTSKVLLDAIEQRVYASYVWVSSPTKKYWEVPPMECELTPIHADKATCTSSDEFDENVARYLE